METLRIFRLLAEAVRLASLETKALINRAHDEPDEQKQLAMAKNALELWRMEKSMQIRALFAEE